MNYMPLVLIAIVMTVVILAVISQSRATPQPPTQASTVQNGIRPPPQPPAQTSSVHIGTRLFIPSYPETSIIIEKLPTQNWGIVGHTPEGKAVIAIYTQRSVRFDYSLRDGAKYSGPTNPQKNKKDYWYTHVDAVTDNGMNFIATLFFPKSLFSKEQANEYMAAQRKRWFSQFSQ